MPKTKKVSAPKMTKVTKAPLPPKTNKVILVVDNDKVLVNVLRMKFEKAGFGVTVANDGIEAIEHMKKTTFHAVVLDLMMPGKNGFDVLDARRASLNGKTPVFVLSAVAKPDTEEKVLKFGATHYFQKFRTPLKDIVDEIGRQVLGA